MFFLTVHSVFTYRSAWLPDQAGAPRRLIEELQQGYWIASKDQDKKLIQLVQHRCKREWYVNLRIVSAHRILNTHSQFPRLYFSDRLRRPHARRQAAPMALEHPWLVDYEPHHGFAQLEEEETKVTDTDSEETARISVLQERNLCQSSKSLAFVRRSTFSHSRTRWETSMMGDIRANMWRDTKSKFVQTSSQWDLVIVATGSVLASPVHTSYNTDTKLLQLYHSEFYSAAMQRRCPPLSPEQVSRTILSCVEICTVPRNLQVSKSRKKKGFWMITTFWYNVHSTACLNQAESGSFQFWPITVAEATSVWLSRSRLVHVWQCWLLYILHHGSTSNFKTSTWTTISFAMQIIVPDISEDGRKFVFLPSPPSDPPTFIDVASSIRFSNSLLYQYESELGAAFISR